MDKLLREIDISSPSHGLVCLANTASFNNTHFSEPLTTYAQGWRDPSNLQGFLDFLFPPVQVPRRFEFRNFGESSDFLYDTDDARSPGADFKRVKYTGSIQQSKTTNRGLTVFVDEDEVRDHQLAGAIYRTSLAPLDPQRSGHGVWHDRRRRRQHRQAVGR